MESFINLLNSIRVARSLVGFMFQQTQAVQNIWTVGEGFLSATSHIVESFDYIDEQISSRYMTDGFRNIPPNVVYVYDYIRARIHNVLFLTLDLRQRIFRRMYPDFANLFISIRVARIIVRFMFQQAQVVQNIWTIGEGFLSATRHIVESFDYIDEQISSRYMTEEFLNFPPNVVHFYDHIRAGIRNVLFLNFQLRQLIFRRMYHD